MSKITRRSKEPLADYLGFTTNDLLDAYGSGDHIPGSGSAAALSAMLAFELLRTVCILTLRKKAYSAVHKELREILRTIQEVYRPQMRKLFEEDIRVFRLVSANRILRDAAVTPAERDRYNRIALRHQRIATTVPIQICETAFEALELAIRVYDIGFKSARGDSGVAISNLLSSVSGSLFIVFLNLKSFRGGKWLRDTRKVAELLAGKFSQSQRDAFRKVIELYQESLTDADQQLNFDFLNRD